MKKYLFGLGAMFVGVGLMFVLMHGEVRAEADHKVMHCEVYRSAEGNETEPWRYCEINNLICVSTRGIGDFSCVKK